MNPIEAVLLGMIEGLTEFLPVSSTGHLILTIDLLGLAQPPGEVFPVFIQAGAVLAVVVAYIKRFTRLGLGFFTSPVQRHFGLQLMAGVVPAVILGAAFYPFIKSMFSTEIVATMLIVGGVLMLALERYAYQPRIDRIDTMSLATAFKIGLVQCAAMIPGVSRSGATILGGLMLGLQRKVAVEFSFFLSVPTIIGAVGYDLYKNHAGLTGADWPVLLIGLGTSFIVALGVIHLFLGVVQRFSFAPFAIYRIAVGSVIWLLLSV